MISKGQANAEEPVLAKLQTEKVRVKVKAQMEEVMQMQ